MNIYLKLVIPSVLSLILIILGLELYWKPLQLDKEKNNFITEVKSLIISGESGIVLNLLEQDFASLYSNMEYFEKTYQNAWHDLHIINAQGKRIYPLENRGAVSTGPDIIPIKHRIQFKDTLLGTLELNADWQVAKKMVLQEINQARNAIAGLILLTLLLSFFTFNFFIINPLKHLTESTIKIASGNLKEDISIVRKDEIGRLAHSFQQMLVELRFQKSALDQHAIISMCNDQGDITAVNEKFIQVSGFSREELIAQNHRIIKSGQTPDSVYKTLWETIKSGDVWHGELCNKTRSGDFYWVNQTILPFTDETGRPVRYLSISSEVSKLKQVELELTRARDIAEKANKAKSEFLSSMSHELRTPLNAIIGFSQILNMNDALNDDDRESSKEIYKAGRHLLSLINEILDLAKIEAGKIELSMENVDLQALASECFSLIQPLADKNGITIKYAVLTDLMVWGDYTRLKQSLLNLLSNAIKYNQENGEVKLNIRATPTEDVIRFDVSDTGKGIPQNQVSMLFHPFERLDAEGGNIEGTGIGLTITRQIIELMGGVIGVSSEPGVGSTFWIELPSRIADAPQYTGNETDAAAGTELSVDLINAEQQNTVLYIEDNPANLKLVSQIFSKRKHVRLLSAHNAELGIEYAIKNKPDLILLDINMPGMDGYQVLDVLKKESCLHDIPVIAVTANAMAKDIERGKAAGFKEYLTKPLDIPYFNQIIEKYLNC